MNPMRTKGRIQIINQKCRSEAPHEVAARVPTLEEAEVEGEVALELEEVRIIRIVACEEMVANILRKVEVDSKEIMVLLLQYSVSLLIPN